MNSTLQKIAFTLLLISCCLMGKAQSDGTLDPTFGNGGLVTADNNGNTDDGNDLLILPDKNMLVGGTTSAGNDYDFSITCFAADGALNSFFGTDGKLFLDIAGGSDDYLSALALDSNLKIVGAGYSKTGPTIYMVVIRFDALGEMDTTFGNDGVVMLNPATANLAYDVAIQPDNKILITGFVDDGLTPEKACIIRLNEDGTYDGSFGDNGVWEGSPDPSYDVVTYSIAVQSDGNILIAGYQDVNDDDQMAVGRILSTGSMDVSFDADGWVVKNLTNVTADIAHSITLQADGKILLAGESHGEIAICRLNIDGTDDTGFASNGTFIDPLAANDDVLYSIIVQPDDHILAAGGGSINDNVDFLLLRLTPNGDFDTTFGSGGIVYTNFGYYVSDDVHSILLQADHKIVAAGSSLNGYYTDVAVARYGEGATGVNELSGDEWINVLPNPCDGNCFLHFTNTGLQKIDATVIDVTGRKLMTRHVPEGERSIALDMNAEPAGIYFVELTDPLEQRVIAREKFVVR